MLKNIRCKRIMGGKTYNTETATQVIGWYDSNDDVPYESGDALYQTRFGAFFHYSFFENMGEDDWEKIEPMTPEQAQAWLEEKVPWRVDLIEQLFGEMPEAGSAEIKYTLRMPESLRDRLAERAKANNQSLNAWIIRCLETCAAQGTADTPNSGPASTTSQPS